MTSVDNNATADSFREVIRIDEGQIGSHVDEVVRASVEQTLNALLDAEADALCGAKRYQRSPDRADTRAGSYDRKLQTKAGEVTLTVPRLRKLPFETQIIERYRRRESSVEEALIEMYLAGVSVRRGEDITEAVWGAKVSASTVSELNQKVYGQIEAWRNRPIEGEHPYVYLDGIWLKRSWGGEVKNVAVLVAARLRHIAGTKWGARRYLDMDRLGREESREEEKQAAAGEPRPPGGAPAEPPPSEADGIQRAPLDGHHQGKHSLRKRM